MPTLCTKINDGYSVPWSESTQKNSEALQHMAQELRKDEDYRANLKDYLLSMSKEGGVSNLVMRKQSFVDKFLSFGCFNSPQYITQEAMQALLKYIPKHLVEEHSGDEQSEKNLAILRMFAQGTFMIESESEAGNPQEKIEGKSVQPREAETAQEITQRFDTNLQSIASNEVPGEALRLFDQCLMDAAKSQKFQQMGERLTEALSKRTMYMTALMGKEKARLESEAQKMNETQEELFNAVNEDLIFSRYLEIGQNGPRLATHKIDAETFQSIPKDWIRQYSAVENANRKIFHIHNGIQNLDTHRQNSISDLWLREMNHLEGHLSDMLEKIEKYDASAVSGSHTAVYQPQNISKSSGDIRAIGKAFEHIVRFEGKLGECRIDSQSLAAVKKDCLDLQSLVEKRRDVFNKMVLGSDFSKTEKAAIDKINKINYEFEKRAQAIQAHMGPGTDYDKRMASLRRQFAKAYESKHPKDMEVIKQKIDEVRPDGLTLEKMTALIQEREDEISKISSSAFQNVKPEIRAQLVSTPKGSMMDRMKSFYGRKVSDLANQLKGVEMQNATSEQVAVLKDKINNQIDKFTMNWR